MIHKDPLVIYVVWRSRDQATVDPLAAKIHACLSGFRRIEPTTNARHDWDEALPTIQPGVPVRFRTAVNDDVPESITADDAEHVVVLVLLDAWMFRGRGTWGGWLDGQIRQLCGEDVSSGPHAIVPISETQAPEKFSAEIGKRNVIRLPDWRDINAILQLVAIRCLQLLKPRRSSAPVAEARPITVFLCHTKRGVAATVREFNRGGEPIAEHLRNHLLKETHARVFFDRNSIGPGLAVEGSIREAIRHSAVLVILSDQLIESEWCLQELQLARDLGRPIVVVNAMETALPRLPATLAGAIMFQYHGIKSIPYIVTATLLEMLREANFHATDVSDPSVRKLFSPDLRQLLKKRGKKVAIYPDPPLPRAELATILPPRSHQQLRTVLEHRTIFEGGSRCQAEKLTRIGLSISSADEILVPDRNNPRGVTRNGLGQRHVDDLFCEIARLLTVLHYQIALGTDLRSDGFTHQLLAVLDTYRRGVARQDLLVWYRPSPSNNSAPFATIDEQETRGTNMRGTDDPGEWAEPIDVAWPTGTERSEARGYTLLRETMNSDCAARIFFGGKLKNYKGAYPGVLEELLLALKSKSPIYLLGGLGGVARGAWDTISGGPLPELFTLDGQRGAHPLHAPLADKEAETFYNDLRRELEEVRKEGLTARNFLEPEDNAALATTTSPAVIATLISRGLAKALRDP